MPRRSDTVTHARTAWDDARGVRARFGSRREGRGYRRAEELGARSDRHQGCVRLPERAREPRRPGGRRGWYADDLERPPCAGCSARLLIALLGRCGLRSSEGVSLHEQAVWRDRPQITIDRVLVRRSQSEVDADTGFGLHLLENNYWQREPPKAGVTATVPLPRPIISPGYTHSIGVLDNTNWRRDVWLPAREAALLRHSDKKTTERHYARAMQERAHDRARRDVLIDKGESLGDRLDVLWFAWVKVFPDIISKLGMDADNVIDLDERRRSI